MKLSELELLALEATPENEALIANLGYFLVVPRETILRMIEVIKAAKHLEFQCSMLFAMEGTSDDKGAFASLRSALKEMEK